MTYDEIKACEPGTPVSLADGKVGTLEPFLDLPMASVNPPLVAVRVYGEPSLRLVSWYGLVDLRIDKGGLVQLRSESR